LLAFVGTLWVIGVVLLAGAVIGQSVNLGGAELPALTSTKVRKAVAAIGVFALLLGLLLYVQSLAETGAAGQAAGSSGSPAADAPQPSNADDPLVSPNVSPTPSSVPDTTSSPKDSPPREPSSAPPTQSKPRAPTVRVRWHGQLLLYSNGAPVGWWLDNVPPTRAVIGDLGLECDCHPGEVVAPAIAAWDGSEPPDYRQCSEMSGLLARRALAVQEGSMACLKTLNGRLGYFTVTSMPGTSEVIVEATIWDRR
jgi:hypothetical protein